MEEDMMYEILSSEKQVSAFGTHSIWFVKVNNKYYYISHQSDLLEIGPEAMAFRCDANGDPFDWTEKAICRGYSSDESFVKIIEQLQLI